MNAFPNHYEQNARASKTVALVEEASKLARRCGLDPYGDAVEIGRLLSKFTAAEWASLSVDAGVRPPSEVTKAMVVARILSRAEGAKQSWGETT